MEQVWLGVVSVAIALVTGLFAWLKIREANDLRALKERVVFLELERVQNVSQIGELQRQNKILRNELRAMTRLLARYQRAANESLIVVDGEKHRIVEWDAAATLMFGYLADETIGKDVSAIIIPPELRQFHRVAMANVFKYKRQPRTVPIKTRAICKNGEYIDVEVQLLPGWETGDGTGEWRYGARIRRLELPSPEAESAEFKVPPGPVRRSDADPIEDS